MSKLVIFDDIFPLPLSAFRFTEFSYYLERIETLTLYSSGGCLKLLGETRSINEVIAEFESSNQALVGRVLPYPATAHLPDADLFYFVFLGNARSFRPELMRNNRPFVFTLYPGGTFDPFQAKTNETLRETMSLPGFRKVIVTQPFTRDYLINGNYCQPDQIVLIPGVVVPEEFLSNIRLQAPRGKEETDICFVAYKYMSGGSDKGYDVFVETARRLLQTGRAVRFHVVGGFGPDDIDVEDIAASFRFYERMSTAELLRFLADMDILVSPNRAGLPNPGKFDGFPTGAAVHAGLQGVAVFASDCLWQNHYLENGKEIILIGHSPTEIAQQIDSFVTDRAKLVQLKQAGKEAFHRLYSIDAQMRPRLELLLHQLQNA